MSMCVYCMEERPDIEGWHGCPRSLRMKDQIDLAIVEIVQSMVHPGNKPMTSMQLKERADSRRDMANTMKTQGVPVRKEYS